MSDSEQQQSLDSQSEKQSVVAMTKERSRRTDLQLPYLTAPGTVKTAFDRIRQAATPDRVTPDFVSTKLQMKGGTGRAVIPFLKKIGMVASDGSPTDLYKSFRNEATGGAAIATAIRLGYKLLGDVNEYFYDLSDKDLKSLIVQVTGVEPSSSTAQQIFSTLKSIKQYANFDAATRTKDDVAITRKTDEPVLKTQAIPNETSEQAIGLNLAYTINLNLPATSDQSVFNAIFKSLKEHLLSNV